MIESFSYPVTQPCTQSLETLNLGHNSVGNEGVHKLKDGLISNRSVLRLGLASTKLSCEGRQGVCVPLLIFHVVKLPCIVFNPFIYALCHRCCRSCGCGGIYCWESQTAASWPSRERDQDRRADGSVIGPESQHISAASWPGQRAQERNSEHGKKRFKMSI